MTDDPAATPSLGVPVSRSFERVLVGLLVVVVGVSVAGLAMALLGVFGVGPVVVFGVAVGYTLWALWGSATVTPGRMAPAGRAVVLLALVVAVGSGYFATGRAFADGEAAAHAIGAEALSAGHGLVFGGDAVFDDTGVALDAPGFAVVDGGRTPDAPRMFTALAGAAAWIGPEAASRLGTALGALALLLGYALASRFLLPGTAAAVVIGLAACPLFLLAARDTDPVALTLVFSLGGLWALDAAAGDDGGAGKAVVAGALIGCAAATSDAGIVVAAAAATVLAAGEIAGLGEGWIPRHRRRRIAAMAAAGAAVPIVLAAVDAALTGRAGEVATRAAILTVPALLVVVARIVHIRRLPVARLTRRIPRFVVPVLIVALAAVAFLVRPGVAASGDEPMQAVAAAQAAEGVAVDPTRTYAEASATWLWWYAPGILAVGLAGWALLAAADLRDRRGRLRIIVVATGFALVVTVVSPGAGPLHPVAAYPFLPLVVPGLLITAGWLAEVLYADPDRSIAQTAAIVLVAAVIAPGVWRSGLVWNVEPQAGAVAGVRAVCGVLEEGDVVVVADPDPALSLGTRLAPGVAAWCGVPAAAIDTGSPELLTTIDPGRGRLVVVTSDPEPFGPAGLRPRRVTDLEVTTLRPTVTVFPADVETVRWTLGAAAG